MRTKALSPDARPLVETQPRRVTPGGTTAPANAGMQPGANAARTAGGRWGWIVCRAGCVAAMRWAAPAQAVPTGWAVSGVLHLVLLAVLAELLVHAPAGGADPLQWSGSWQVQPLAPERLEVILSAEDASHTAARPVAAMSTADAVPMTDASDFPAVTPAAPAAAGGSLAGAGGAGGGASGRGGAGFFGTTAEGRTFVYIVDLSGSMQGERFRRAMGELIRSISSLSSEQSFYVLFFNSETFPLYYPKPASALVAADPETKRRAARWIRSARPNSTTDPTAAIERALALAPDVVFLLTDGELNDPEAVCELTRSRNGGRTIIHTIGFGNREGEATLQRIAAENGGSYRFVK